jgi:hypothetical protein
MRNRLQYPVCQAPRVEGGYLSCALSYTLTRRLNCSNQECSRFDTQVYKRLLYSDLLGTAFSSTAEVKAGRVWRLHASSRAVYDKQRSVRGLYSKREHRC